MLNLKTCARSVILLAVIAFNSNTYGQTKNELAVRIEAGTSVELSVDFKARELLVRDSGTVRVTPTGPETVNVYGLKPGRTTVTLRQGKNEIAKRFEIEVYKSVVGERKARGETEATAEFRERIESRLDELEAKLDAILKAIESLKSHR